MAKQSSIEKNERRARMNKKFRSKRTALKEIVMDKTKTFEERFTATVSLAELPRNSAQCRYRKRCKITGRARGNYAKFQLSRIMFRSMASEGLIPGVTKSSW